MPGKMFVPLFVLTVFLMAGCTGAEKTLATSDETAVFVPFVADYDVDIFVDEVDGEATRFGELDRVVVDAGSRELSVRLEYQPGAGSSVIIGGLANLLVRAGTNKTFRTQLTVDVEAGHVYKLTAGANKSDGLDLAVFDETIDKEVVKYSFGVKDGRIERIF